MKKKAAICFSGTTDDMMVPEAAPLVVQQSTTVPGIQAAVNLEIRTEQLIKRVYPVPATDRLNLNLSSGLEQSVTVGIFNTNDTLMVQKRIDLYVGDNLHAPRPIVYPVL